MQRIVKTHVMIADDPDGEAFPVTVSLLRRDGRPTSADTICFELPEDTPQEFRLSAHKLQRFLAHEGRCDNLSCTICAPEGE